MNILILVLLSGIITLIAQVSVLIWEDDRSADFPPARVVAKTLGNLFAFLQLFCFVQRFLRYLNRVCNPALLNRGF